MTATSPNRRIEVMVAPVITFIAVVALIFIARVYDDLPVKAPECRLKSTFGLSCPTCGGTRSMQALAHGEFGRALQFNPMVFLGGITSFVWLFFGIRSYVQGYKPLSVPEQNRRIKRTTGVILGLLLINWVYLIIFLE